MPRIRKPIPGVDPKLLIKDAAKLLPDPRGGCSCAAALSARRARPCSPAATSSTASRPKRVLSKISDFNDRVQAWLFDPNRLAQTYPESAITRPFRFNAYYPESDIPEVDGEDYKLEVGGLVDEQEDLDARGALRAAAGDADHAAHLRRGLERDRQMDGRAARRFPAPGRRRPHREIRLVPLRRGLSRLDRHGDRAASADADDAASSTARSLRPNTASPCASASRPSSASRTPST